MPRCCSPSRIVPVIVTACIVGTIIKGRGTHYAWVNGQGRRSLGSRGWERFANTTRTLYRRMQRIGIALSRDIPTHKCWLTGQCCPMCWARKSHLQRLWSTENLQILFAGNCKLGAQIGLLGVVMVVVTVYVVVDRGAVVSDVTHVLHLCHKLSIQHCPE